MLRDRLPLQILGAFLVMGIVLSAGCSRQQPDGSETKAAEAMAATGKRGAGMDLPSLRAAASRAVREQRLYSPAGDNAMEWYMALREKQPDDPALATTLLELEPYAVIAAEQSLARSDFEESARLIAMINRANPEASALPRLRKLKLAAEDRQRQASLLQEPLVDAPSALAPTRHAAAGETGLAGAAVLAAPSMAAPAEPAVVDSRMDGPIPDSQASASIDSTSAAPVQATRQEAGGSSRTPALLRDRTPRYPAMALRRKVEGQVELGFTIKADGSVADVRVLSASPEGFFEEAAIATSRFWQFEASGRDTSTSRTIRFSLPKPAP